MKTPTVTPQNAASPTNTAHAVSAAHPGEPDSTTTTGAAGPSRRPLHWRVSATDADLVEACREGDTLSWAELMRRHSPRLRSIAARQQRLDEDAAEDAVQTAWCELWRRLDTIEQPDRVGSWLATTVTRRARKIAVAQRVSRERARACRLVEPEADPSAVDDHLLADETRAAVRTAIGRMRPRDQRLLNYLYPEATQYSYEEIASMMGWSKGSVGPNRGRTFERFLDLYDADAGSRRPGHAGGATICGRVPASPRSGIAGAAADHSAWTPQVP